MSWRKEIPFYPKDSEKRAKHLLRVHPGINEMMFDQTTHDRYRAYTEKEVKAENVYRLPKLNWIAEGCPIDPIPIIK